MAEAVPHALRLKPLLWIDKCPIELEESCLPSYRLGTLVRNAASGQSDMYTSMYHLLMEYQHQKIGMAEELGIINALSVKPGESTKAIRLLLEHHFTRTEAANTVATAELGSHISQLSALDLTCTAGSLGYEDKAGVMLREFANHRRTT